MSKFMRIIVFFDLPVSTKTERHLATSFRRFLLNDGYYMLQFSVYARLCNSVENAEQHFARLEKEAPKDGSVRCMIVTEKQYASMKIITGKKKVKESSVDFFQLSFL